MNLEPWPGLPVLVTRTPGRVRGGVTSAWETPEGMQPRGGPAPHAELLWQGSALAERTVRGWPPPPEAQEREAPAGRGREAEAPGSLLA